MGSGSCGDTLACYATGRVNTMQVVKDALWIVVLLLFAVCELRYLGAI